MNKVQKIQNKKHKIINYKSHKMSLKMSSDTLITEFAKIDLKIIPERNIRWRVRKNWSKPNLMVIVIFILFFIILQYIYLEFKFNSLNYIKIILYLYKFNSLNYIKIILYLDFIKFQFNFQKNWKQK